MAEPVTRTEPGGLTPLERDVMKYLLDGEDPTLRLLRQQVTSATVARREYTGVGFFVHFSIDPEAPRIPQGRRFTLGDVEAQLPAVKRGAGFVLFIEQGTIQMLEGFTYDEPWPNKTTDFRLFYASGGKRSLEAMRKRWE